MNTATARLEKRLPGTRIEDVKFAPKVTKIEEKKVGERTACLLNVISVTQNVTEVNNMLFMKKGDVYMEYCSHFPKGKINYPNLRGAIEEDLNTVPVTIQVIDKKEVKFYPWGKMSPKMKAHSLAVSILKTFQRRSLNFGKSDKLENITVFSKWDKKANEGKGATENKTLESISKKSVHKEYDEARAIAFLDSFLRPVKAVKTRKAA